MDIKTGQRKKVIKLIHLICGIVGEFVVPLTAKKKNKWVLYQMKSGFYLEAKMSKTILVTRITWIQDSLEKIVTLGKEEAAGKETQDEVSWFN